MTYADLVEPLRRDVLARLGEARMSNEPPAFAAAVFRPLGAALLLRLARDPAIDLEEIDPLSIAAAHDMLAAWLSASVGDPTPAPADCSELPTDDAARLALCAFLNRHWPAR